MVSVIGKLWRFLVCFISLILAAAIILFATMVFNTIGFAVFFLVVFNIYIYLNNRSSIKLRNIFLLLASYFFYGWWDWRFLSLILISSFTDFFLGSVIYTTRDERKKKIFLLCSIAINIGILGFFKYFNFFIDSLENILSLVSIDLNTQTFSIILPVGISFYTFQTLSYTIDIYRKKLKPTNDFFAFFTFVAFFPQLVAGPIERAERLLPQFKKHQKITYPEMIAGLRLIIWGLFKKVVIADNLAIIVDHIYNPEVSFSGLAIILATFFFAFQIYCDFSGYSDIAIGLARMMGFSLITNFTTPYFSTSFSEFWHRWHISLSTWFRDYVYIPLGGNKKGIKKNILITFIISGLWHGANITFLIWGALHGIILVIEKSISFKNFKILRFLIVFTIISLLWIPFRAENFSHTAQLLKGILTRDYVTSILKSEILTIIPVQKLLILSCVFILFIVMEFQLKLKDFNQWIESKHYFIRWSFYIALFITILFLANYNVKPNFIYFQF